jgi:ribosomal protein L33
METYLSIVVSLFIIEVLLSVDNALVNATLAEALPEEKRKKALRIGILLGAVFRIVALFLVAIIIQNVWLKVLGGLYLVYLAIAIKMECENCKTIGYRSHKNKKTLKNRLLLSKHCPACKMHTNFKETK